MIIIKDALCRAMKEAYRNGGYIVAGDPKNGSVTICTGFWCVRFEKEQTPRKILGLLAEHIGKLPTAGEALRVKKREVQTEIYEVALSPWQERLKAICDGEAVRLGKTHFTWRGAEVWQCPTNQSVMFFNPDVIGIVDLSAGGGLSVRGTAYFRGAVSDVFVCPVEMRAAEDLQAIGALEQRLWTH